MCGCAAKFFFYLGKRKPEEKVTGGKESIAEAEIHREVGLNCPWPLHPDTL